MDVSCRHLGCKGPALSGGYCAQHQLSPAARELRATLSVGTLAPEARRIVLVDALEPEAGRPRRMQDEITVSGRLQRAGKRRSPVA